MKASVVALLAMGVISVAVAWSSVPITDRGADCGSALHAAWNGMAVPVVNQPLTPSQASAAQTDGIAITTANSHSVTYCQGQGRIRVVESGGGVIAVVTSVAVYARRRPGRPPLTGGIASAAA